MPKIKTNRAAAKRFKKTGTGKLKSLQREREISDRLQLLMLQM